MTTRPLVDPESLFLLDLLPTLNLSADGLAIARQFSVDREAALPPTSVEGVRRTIPGPMPDSTVDVLVYNPPSTATNRGALLHIHGGGMVIGTVGQSRLFAGPLLDLDVVVVSVEYRLAPDTPFPGPQEDCYAGLQWLVKHAAELGVDPTRIVIGGESAGGGLAAGVALMVRDRGEFSIAGQLLTYPMLDHRTGGPDDPYQNPITGEFVWTRQSNQFGWKSLQGDYQLDDERIGWFSPSRAADLTGLAPIFIATGMLDLFFDENLDYIRRATAAGVPTELHSYPGAFHAFNAVNTTTIGKQFWSDLIRGMQRLIRA
jgi:acetyl esterase